MLRECLGEKTVDELNEDGSWSVVPVKLGERMDQTASNIHTRKLPSAKASIHPRAELKTQTVVGSGPGRRRLTFRPPAGPFYRDGAPSPEEAVHDPAKLAGVWRKGWYRGLHLVEECYQFLSARA